MINKIYLIPLTASLFLAGCTTQGPTPQTAAPTATTPQVGNIGLVSQKSANDFDGTYAKLRAAIAGNPALTIIAEVDHAENASKVGLNLRPTKLIIFGNPNLGTPLMQDSATAGIDLPQKFLVYQEGADVFVVYNDPAYLAQRHNINNQDAELNKISGALQKLSGAAITK